MPSITTAAAAAKFPVIIAGAGPTGLTLSRLLSQLGIGSLLLERAPGLTRHPQAHFINNRTMEVFRQMRIKDSSVAAEVLKHSPLPRDWRKFIYCESLTGNILGEVDHFKGQEGPRMLHLSPEPVAHLSQHRLLPILLKAATAPDVHGEVKFGHMISGMDCSPSGRILLTIDEAKSRSYRVECDYLIAADGANSRIRTMLGVKMMGIPIMQHLVNIHFMAPGLRDHLHGREAMLYFVFNSEVITVVVAHDLQRGEFVAQVPFFPPTQSLADFPEDICERLLKSAIGVPDLDLEVRSVRRWTMRAEVAEQFKVGKVFLAGDAAHRFPPAGGFGMNTGIQDAHNLAWKLAAEIIAVIKRETGEDLLESFEAERKAIAVANTELSVSNWKEALKVPRALGLDPAAANVLHSAVTSRPASMLPSGIVKSALETGLSLGRAISGMKGPLRPWRERLLRDIFAAGDTLRLQYPKEDLGFIYNAPGAAIDSVTSTSGMAGKTGGGGTTRVWGSTGAGRQQITDQSRGRPYVPSTRPGARLPHCDIAVVRASRGADVQQQHISTLDLMPYRSTRMQLWLSGGQGANIWADAALQLQREGVILKVVHICKDHEDAHLLLQAKRTQQMKDNVTVAVDLMHQWQHLREVLDAGAIMVRPDGHVAWRALSQLQQSGHEPCLAQHASILRDALHNILRTPRGCAAGRD